MPVYCPSCGAENRDNARFCIQCGASLSSELICPSCSTKNPDNARFCLQCGAQIRGATPAAGLTGMLSANTTLSGRYLIVKRLGKGGMGAVYQAADTRLTSKTWAVKEMSDAAILDPAEKQQAREAFQREAHMLALLDHVNLPKVNDFFTEGGKLYLVMDYIEGQTLQAMLEARPDPFPEAQVVEWAGQVCDVLDYLHRCMPPIIFRDLKPSNIMIDASKRVKLIDFGVARLFKAGQARDTANFGTAGYAPPEQYGKGQTDARSDIYALGVTLHELLTRYDPALTPFVLPPARKVNPAVSEQLEVAILKATQAAQVDRFQRATDFKTALTQATLVAAKPVVAPSPVAPKPQLVVTPSPVAMKPQPIATPSPIAVPAVIQSKPSVIEPEMIVIPAGEFLMGSNRSIDGWADSDELPFHKVNLDGYAIGKYPVTQAQYQAFIQATSYRLPLSGYGYSEFVKWDHTQRTCLPANRNCPVVLIDWADANAYCHWLLTETGQTYRLPTEAEWEKAARGTDGRLYPWGNSKPTKTVLNFDGQLGHITEVTQYPNGSSPFGVMDVAGNVREWVADWYEGYYDTSVSRNPAGPKSGVHRVLRGGSWMDGKSHVRVACRFKDLPKTQAEVIGFRVAYSI